MSLLLRKIRTTARRIVIFVTAVIVILLVANNVIPDNETSDIVIKFLENKALELNSILNDEHEIEEKEISFWETRTSFDNSTNQTYQLEFLVRQEPVSPFHNYRYIQYPPDVCTSKPDLFILAVIHSAPDNYCNRMLIRETWGNRALYKHLKTVVLFMVGTSEDPKKMLALTSEFRKYGDLVQGNFYDSYKNLSLKSLMWLKFSATYCQNAAYVVKSDDDIFVNIFNVVSHLVYLSARNIATNRTILCNIWLEHSQPAVRDPANKWYVTEEEYPGPDYPQYCSGSAYILTGDLLYPMYHRSKWTKFFWIDDVYTTGLLPRRLNCTYHDMASLYSFDEEIAANVLESSEALFAHLPQAMTRRYRYWKNLMKTRKLKH